jgi:16S rRNA A1518/A1519 N6-dimethyltransferase RsmA/KsgA/DIM1 with predicted DNA glycosylase/AP lyase activity
VFMQVNFKTIFLMELVISNIPIKTNILDNLLKEKNMEKEIIFLVKELYFQDIGIMIIKFRVN